jgi:hypothetical protein
LEKVDEHNSSAVWQAFAKLLRRLVRDGLRLRKRPDFTPEKYRSRILRLGRRLDALIATVSDDADARRLLKPRRAGAAADRRSSVHVPGLSAHSV